MQQSNKENASFLYLLYIVQSTSCFKSFPKPTRGQDSAWSPDDSLEPVHVGTLKAFGFSLHSEAGFWI